MKIYRRAGNLYKNILTFINHIFHHNFFSSLGRKDNLDLLVYLNEYKVWSKNEGYYGNHRLF